MAGIMTILNSIIPGRAVQGRVHGWGRVRNRRQELLIHTVTARVRIGANHGDVGAKFGTDARRAGVKRSDTL